jgi:carnitine-CoA ligase
MQRAKAENATLLRGVGAMAMALLNQPERDDDWRNGFLRASFPPLEPAARERFETRFGVRVTNQLYGQTECIPISIGADVQTQKAHSNGQPAADLSVVIVDDDDQPVRPGTAGEIAVRPTGPHAMFSGYWKSPDATEKSWRSGWFHTGDLGKIDDTGHLYFLDRKNDSIRRRGENVSSIELENAICAHPHVRQAAVIGVKSDMTEDDIVAYVVFDEHAPARAQFREFLTQALPRFALPRWIIPVTDIPQTHTGRIQKQLLRSEHLRFDLAWDLAAEADQGPL